MEIGVRIKGWIRSDKKEWKAVNKQTCERWIFINNLKSCSDEWEWRWGWEQKIHVDTSKCVNSSKSELAYIYHTCDGDDKV